MLVGLVTRVPMLVLVCSPSLLTSALIHNITGFTRMHVDLKVPLQPNSINPLPTSCPWGLGSTQQEYSPLLEKYTWDGRLLQGFLGSCAARRWWARWVHFLGP